jgi:3-methylcrotonyl-CoA carboxylase alpha subunit
MVHAEGVGALMARSTLQIDGITFQVDVEPGRILVDGVETAPPRHARAVASGDTRWVFVDGDVYEFEVQRPGRRGGSSHHASLMAPMPATVRRINVAAGAQVSKGDTLLVLEAMKMELPVRAPHDGVVTAVSCKEGDLVQAGVPLLELE